MSATVGSAFEILKTCLGAGGMFFYLPAAAWQALQAGERDIVVFHDQEQSGWREHYLHWKIQKIQLGEMTLFPPTLTNSEAWEEIRRHLSGALSQEYHHRPGDSAHLALDDGSVVRFLWCRVRIGKRRQNPYPTEYHQEDDGWLVVVQHLYLAYAVDRVRRELERLLREGDRAHVIRFAKLAGIHIPGEMLPPHPQEGSAT